MRGWAFWFKVAFAVTATILLVAPGPAAASSFGLDLSSPWNASPTAATGACTINWDGGAGTTDWNTPANWDTNALPAPTDNVCIAAGAPGTQVTHSALVGTQIASIDSGKPLAVSGGVLTIAGASTLTTLSL